MSKTTFTTRQATFLIIAGFLTIIVYGLYFSLQGHALIRAWIVPVLSLIPVGLLLIPWLTLWQRLSGFDNRIVAGIFHFVILTGILSATCLFINTLGKSQSTRQEAVITRLYRKETTRSRRINRRVYVSEKSGWSYHATVTLADGRSKDIVITARQYGHSHINQPIDVELRRGSLGIDIIDIAH